MMKVKITKPARDRFEEIDEYHIYPIAKSIIYITDILDTRQDPDEMRP